MIKDIKYQGHSAVPSDYECMDGELAGCYNLIPEDGALHPIMPPTIKFTLNAGEELLWLHQMTGHTHYIIMYTSTSGSTTTQSLKWVCEENADAVGESPWTRHDITGSTITGTPTISSIGNTLIVNDDNGLRYFLWKPDNVELVNSVETTVPKYLALGQKPPMLEITFGLHSDFAVWPDKKNTGPQTRISDYKGATVDVGAIKYPVVPRLGESEGDSGAAWAGPQPEMEAHSGSDPVDERIRQFANEYATYSIDGLYGANDDETTSISTIKSRLASGVFANLNYFINELGTNKNKFAMPFFVRYAYKLYDDSYIRHSYPVLMMPNSRGPIFGLDGNHGLCLNKNDDAWVHFKINGRVYGFLSELVYSIQSNTIATQLEQWKDIITSVVICVSPPIYTYDQAGDVLGWTNMDDADSWDEYYSLSKVMKLGDEDVSDPEWDGVRPFKDTFESLVDATANDYFVVKPNTTIQYKYPSYIATIPQRDISEINNLITSTANFHIIKELSLDEIATCTEAPLDLDKGTLGGLLGRSTMDDDYHTHDALGASMMHNFNGRMNFAGVTRMPHNPLLPDVQFTQLNDLGEGSSWEVAVSIKNDMEQVTVASASGDNGIDFPRWIYYPDANAKFAYVKKTYVSNGNTVEENYKLKLTPHELLNGAYWLANIMSQDVVSGLDTSADSVPSISTTGFNEVNKVYTSNVYNPFVFVPTNINTVGTGKILGLCAAVKPLADDQYGKAPLYVFSTEGIWAMDTTAKGTYASVWPLPRDVLSKIGDNYNAASITQLDDAVLFATDKGIMLLSGSQTQCITDAISSEFPFDITELPDSFASYLSDDGYDVNAMSLQPFASFLGGCRMIYDYVHQRIAVYNSSYNYAYVYSLKDHKWGMMVTNIDYGINSYPEALAVTDAGTGGTRSVVNLSDEVLYNTVDNEQVPVHVKGLIVTRPLKLDQPDALKTIDTIIQRGKFDFLKSGRTPKPIRSILFGSRDLYNWHLVSSSTDHYLRGFSGTPYKYFRIVALVDFLADESVYGATIQYNPRYLNRPR